MFLYAFAAVTSAFWSWRSRYAKTSMLHIKHFSLRWGEAVDFHCNLCHAMIMEVIMWILQVYGIFIHIHIYVYISIYCVYIHEWQILWTVRFTPAERPLTLFLLSVNFFKGLHYYENALLNDGSHASPNIYCKLGHFHLLLEDYVKGIKVVLNAIAIRKLNS